MQALHIQPKENIIQIDNWQEYWRDGKQFLRTAVNARYKQKKAFTPEVIYNLVAMSIEKYIMAVLMKNGDLAENHTMGDLIHALERHAGSLPDLAAKLKYLDTFQELCSLEAVDYPVPTAEEIVTIVTIGKEVQLLLTPHLKE